MSSDHPRLTVTRTKVAEAQTEVERAEAALESELRHVRNLAILAPLQKASRERVEAALEPLGRRIKQLRLQIARTHCVQDILLADLAAFEAELAPAALDHPQPSNAKPNLLEPPVTETTGAAGRPESSSGSFYSAIDDHVDS